MIKLLIFVSGFFLTIGNLYAEVKIKPAYRIENRGYGVCAWAAIETSALQANITVLRGITDYRDKRSREKVQRVELHYGQDGWYRETVVDERRDHAGTTRRIIDQLWAYDVDYEMQTESSDYRYDTKILYDGTRDGQPGVIIGLYNYGFDWDTEPSELGYLFYEQRLLARGYHAVLLTDIDDDYVTFIDSNDTRLPWRMARDIFDENWDGWGLILRGPVEKR